MRDRRAIIGALAAWDIAWRLAAITVAVKRRDWRWVVPLAGFALAAAGGAWSERVSQALENADERDWARLRRAGRIGNRFKPRAK